MRRLGWIDLQSHPTASGVRLMFSLKLCIVLLILFTTSLITASPAEIQHPLHAKHGKQPNNDHHELNNKKLHSSNNGAGRSLSFQHSSASPSPNPKHYNLHSSIHKPYAAAISTARHHNTLLPETSLSNSFAGPRSINDWMVADLILVSSIDGSLHARDRQTGLEVWEIPGDTPLVQVSTSEELKNKSKLHTPSSSTCEDCDIIWIVEPLGEGTLYYFTPATGLQQLPITIKELVMQSPFSLRGDDKIYIGSHSTTLYSIESGTGKILKAYGAGKSSLSHAGCRTQRTPFYLDDMDEMDSAVDEDEDEDYTLKSSEENGSFMIGRTDYKLEIHGKNEIIWNVTYSTWGPNNIDSDLKAQHLKSPDNLYITPLYDSSILALSTDGSKKPARWVGHISSVAINVFDVFRPYSGFTDSTLMLLPQPGFFPADVDDKHLLSSTLIQRTEDGGWFAMSGRNFPSLVRSAPYARWSQLHTTGYPTHEDLWKSLIGVHRKRNNDIPFNHVPGLPGSSNSNNHLRIDGPSTYKSGSQRERKLQNRYDYMNQVYKPSSEMSRSSPPNPLPPTPPQPPIGSTPKSRILSGFLRILENALAFFVFFIFLLVASRYGWLKQVSGLAEFIDKIQPDVTTGETADIDAKVQPEVPIPKEHIPVLDGTVTPMAMPTIVEKVISPSTPITLQFSDFEKTPISTPKRVEILEPTDKEEDTSTPGTPLPGAVKKRKRGSRGGRKNNSAKKKEQLLLEQAEAKSSEAKSSELLTLDSNSVVDILSKGPIAPPQNSLLDVSTDVIGYGSHGTVVLKGTFENREVAVKRMLLDFYEVASQEVSLLQESDDHPNVIRYFCKQISDRFLYIALELCPGTLEDLIEKPDDFLNLSSLLTPTQILYQIASGVAHLHSLKIVHRDLKPQNILVAPPKVLQKKDLNKNSQEVIGPVRMLISDFGLCKKLEGDQSSFRATTANAAGTSGWRAPELLIDEQDSVYNHTIISGTELEIAGTSSEPLVIDSLSNRRATRAIDIFSLGCVFYYILSKGQHPFGDKYLREANIVQGSFSFECLEDDTKPDMVEARDLIGRMISRDPRHRPDAKEVLKHPLFWSSDKRLDFLLKVSDRFDIEPRDPPSELLVLLEEDSNMVVGEDWHEKLDPEFVSNLGKYRKYHGDRTLDLLRAMRNKSHHFNDLPASVREAMEPYPEGYLAYFTKRFPFLLMNIYYVVKNNLADEVIFRSFF